MDKKVLSYRDLIVWKKGVEFEKEIYDLSDQLRRASVSIPINVAEGQARQHTTLKSKIYYLQLIFYLYTLVSKKIQLYLKTQRK